TRCFDEGSVVSEFSSDGSDAPRCPRCGGYLRPGVVWFNETLPEATLRSAREQSARCDVFFSIGTSSVVYPAAELPRLAKVSGALLVETNPSPTPLRAQADCVLAGMSATVLPELVKELRQRRGWSVSGER